MHREFEPPTARFVAELLYPAELRMHRELLITTDTAKKMVHPGGITVLLRLALGPLLKQRYSP